MFKGEGCNRTEPKSFRPVALLSAMSRVMEALLAKQLYTYQEEQGLVHQGVHGFRKGRGCNTAILEVWEYVLRKTEKGELVALDVLDVSAGFDTLVYFEKNGGAIWNGTQIPRMAFLLPPRLETVCGGGGFKEQEQRYDKRGTTRRGIKSHSMEKLNQ